MIAVTCLNPAFDRTMEVSQLRPGEVNRTVRTLLGAGGKGVNVATVLQTLGEEARCYGFTGKENMQQFMSCLELGMDAFCPIPVEGRVRTNTKIVSLQDHAVTEVNEAGPEINENAISTLLERMQEDMQQIRFMVLTGSIPVGCRKDVYRLLMTQFRVPVFLDASGDVLREGVSGAPAYVKPNLAELEEWYGMPVRDTGTMIRAARLMLDAGVHGGLVSMGAQGAWLILPQKVYHAEALSVPVCSTVGAGDAMVAGFLYGYLHHGDELEALCHGTACGAASVMTPGTGLVRYEDYRALLPKVKVELYN